MYVRKSLLGQTSVTKLTYLSAVLQGYQRHTIIDDSLFAFRGTQDFRLIQHTI